MTTSVGRASGRLDLLGGVADYSGALVLEVPTRATTTVTAEPADKFEVGDVHFTSENIRALANDTNAAVRSALAGTPAWIHYPVGVAIVLVRHGVIDPPRARLTVTSTLPIALGVSSSAALEIATARALGADRLVDPLRLAALCQEAENGIVGAPCGIMDQIAVAMGETGAVLPILCRPASVEPSVPLPSGIEVVGWPSGAPHDIAAHPYGRARAAAFMGKRIVEGALFTSFRWTSELPTTCIDELPDELAGDQFIAKWSATDDLFTTVEPDVMYPVRAATAFGINEHHRTNAALQHLQLGNFTPLRRLLEASHSEYTLMGLGHPATDEIVDAALARPGVYGARTSGGGSGGTVVIVCDRGALDDVEDLIR